MSLTTMPQLDNLSGAILPDSKSQLLENFFFRGSQSLFLNQHVARTPARNVKFLTILGPTESETLGWSPAICFLTSSPGDPDIG